MSSPLRVLLTLELKSRMQVLEGDAMFAKGAPEDGEELAARTVGLVTNAEFKGWLY